MSKTIKELAEELGVTKTAIRKYMTEEFRQKYVQTTANGLLVINDEGANLLQSLRKLPQTPQTKFAETNANLGLQSMVDMQTETIAFLKAQLEAKDTQIRVLQEQLSEKDGQIAQLTTALENTTTALSASQALHVADKKLLLEQQEQKPSFWQRFKRKKDSE